MKKIAVLFILGLAACNMPESKKTTDDKPGAADSIRKAKETADSLKEAGMKNKTVPVKK